MTKDIYDFRDYKAYLKHWIAQKPGKGRGIQTALAERLGCQTGYVSQVLNSHANFSLEQAEAVNQYIGHSYEEGHLFLLLVELARAGTQDLKKRFQNEIDKVLNQRLLFKDRVDIKKTLEPVDQATYYSSWYYAAIHVAVSVPSLRSREALMLYFNLSSETLTSALNFLVSVGLLEKKGDQYTQG
ncbi:MAG: TIGR02147 family protein, partial [Bdellovibrionales bacterium]